MRARMIKPAFFLNEELAAIGTAGMVLFAGLWCAADREGRLEDRPARLKVQILPYLDCDVDSLLGQLEAKGFIVRYEVEGIRYLEVVNFLKHQNPHPKEPKSLLPPAPFNYTALHEKQCKGEPRNEEIIPAKEVIEVIEGIEIFSSEGDARGNQTQTLSLNGTSHLTLEADSQKPDKLTPEDLVEAWNRIVAPKGLPRVEALSGDRRKTVLKRIAESEHRAAKGSESAEDFWSYVLTTISESAFLRGMKPTSTHPNFKAVFDWVIKNDTNALKIREGNYG